jgi:Leucine-rich repeat (LRR) protein
MLKIRALLAASGIVLMISISACSGKGTPAVPSSNSTSVTQVTIPVSSQSTAPISAVPSVIEVKFADANLERAVREAVNKIEGPLDRSDLAGLKILNAWGMGIENLHGIEFCTGLNIITIGKNKIEDLSPLATLLNLKAIDAMENKIADLSPLTSIKTLVSLNLNFNKITDISALAVLSELSSLSLQGGVEKNRVKDLSPLKALPKLRQLWAPNNLISDISPMVDLPHLADLTIFDNPLSAESRDFYIPRLKEKGVNVLY